MNLLLCDLPTSIIDVNGNLYFDTDELSVEDSYYDGECKTYAINTNFKRIIDIMLMYETAQLNDNEKAMCMLKMFYEEVPEDISQAFTKAMEFLDCEKIEEKSKELIEFEKRRQDKYGRLYSWEQDGDIIYGSINYSHNDALKNNPDMHYWEFKSKFMNLKEDCKFYDVINNRLAHKLKKATDEQKMARKEFPEIYILKADRKAENKLAAQMKEFERKLNN